VKYEMEILIFFLKKIYWRCSQEMKLAGTQHPSKEYIKEDRMSFTPLSG
jgi:hypothetical protein